MTPLRPPSSSGTPWWLIAIVAAILIALFGAWRAGLLGGDDGLFSSPPAATPGSAPAPGAQAPGTPPPAVPPAPGVPPLDASQVPQAAQDGRPEGAREGPRYPVPALDEEERRRSPLPEPGIASDPPLAEALANFADRSTLTGFFSLQDIARRFVVTVDNLPREIVPSQTSLLRRIPGPLEVAPAGEAFELRESNYQRYQPFVRFVEAIDPASVARLYVRFYPLFQYEYQQLGYPDGHFNDRVIAAIDDMLAAPTPREPIMLVQPKVLYRFADPRLESLSAGQKIMIRIGPDNARRLRAVLTRLRGQLANLGN